MVENIEEKTPGKYDAFEKKSELYVPKEERGHLRSEEEIKTARESIPEEKKIESVAEKTQKAEDWHETFYKMGGTRGREKLEAIEREMAQEKKAIESAKIPKEGMKIEEVLKEAGIQKPAESFDDAQKRLAERLEGGRTFEGKKFSESDKFIETRKFFLEELDYSVKYKGLLLDKAEILDENGKSVMGDKNKPLEFKSFYFQKTEKSINDFLQEKLREKLEGKPAEKLTEEQNLEAGYQKTIKAAENAQAEREAKISFIQNAKTFSKEKLDKFMEGLARISLRGKIDLGLSEGKRLAIEGGRDLAVLMLKPLAALEKAGQKIAGEFQTGAAMREKRFREERIKYFESLPRFEEYVEFLKKESLQVNEKWGKAYESMNRKGRILKFIEGLGDRFG